MSEKGRRSEIVEECCVCQTTGVFPAVFYWVVVFGFCGVFLGLAQWKAVLAGWQIVGLEFSCERHGHQSC